MSWKNIYKWGALRKNNALQNFLSELIFIFSPLFLWIFEAIKGGNESTPTSNKNENNGYDRCEWEWMSIIDIASEKPN